MSKKFLEKLAEKTPLIFDGGMGTLLMQKGLGNVLAETLNLDKSGIITEIHRAYVEAGADIIETNTFNGSYLKLKEFGLEKKLAEINKAAVANALKASQGRSLVAGSIGPTGKLMEPIGKLSFDEAKDSYQNQIEVLYNAGVNLFIIETISDIQEMRAALIAAKEVCNLPVICSMTYNDDGKTLTGTDMFTAAVTLAELGATVISLNCSMGPEGVLKLFEKNYKLLGEVNKPLMVMPNAGLPVIEDDKAVYRMTPVQFADIMDNFRRFGISIYGGCCGTTPAHIKALAEKVKGRKITFHYQKKDQEVYFTSRSKVIRHSEAKPFLKIGESLNPTARKQFMSELKEGRDGFLREEAKKQTKEGAHLLDINVGVPETDHKKLMKKCIQTLTTIVDTPLCIDSDEPGVIEEALKNYPGLALINSINGKKSSMEKIIPLAKKYGAALVALTLNEKGIPEQAAGRLKIAENIGNFARKNDYPVNKLFFDGLVMTVSSEPRAPLVTLETTEKITNKDLKTSLGVSNVSFGLPQRKNINNVFLKLLAKKGLTAAIISTATYREIAKYTPEEKLAEAVLLGRDKNAKKYIEIVGQQKAVKSTLEKKKVTGLSVISEAVIDGEESNILDLVEAELKSKKAQEILDGALLPALEKVGEYYSEGKYYLPQMIASANTMKKAFERLKADLKADLSQSIRGTAIICTVEGDIHDIGKNIVAMMLENHGFEVVDLGKNVPADKIVAGAKKHHANIVLLSALLTTTMLKMKEVKQALKAAGLDIPVMVGGAVVTGDFARNFGAYYTEDAASATKIAKKLVEKK